MRQMKKEKRMSERNEMCGKREGKGRIKQRSNQRKVDLNERDRVG